MMHDDERTQRYVDMIVDELEKGRTREEIIALYKLTQELYDTLEADTDIAKSFEQARTKAFLSDLESLKKGCQDRYFNHGAASLYFANRYGWSLKPQRSTIKLKSTDDILDAACTNKIDVDVALNLLKSIALSDDIKYRRDDRAYILELVEKLKKFAAENNLA